MIWLLPQVVHTKTCWTDVQIRNRITDWSTILVKLPGMPSTNRVVAVSLDNWIIVNKQKWVVFFWTLVSDQPSTQQHVTFSMQPVAETSREHILLGSVQSTQCICHKDPHWWYPLSHHQLGHMCDLHLWAGKKCHSRKSSICFKYTD